MRMWYPTLVLVMAACGRTVTPTGPVTPVGAVDSTATDSTRTDTTVADTGATPPDTSRTDSTGTTPPDTLHLPPADSGLADLGLNASLNGRAVFPATDPWNQPVDTAAVDPNSTAILTQIGLSKPLHPDFGSTFGIPYIVVPDTLTRSPVSFDYASESDPGPYPIPANPPIEPDGDGHLLVIVQHEWKLYELFALSAIGGSWHGGSGAIFDLTHGTTRPAGWTSADAAGLPIFPGLVRYDEVYQRGEIDHALRFTVQRTRSAYLAPARHSASNSYDTLRPPMGMRVRLKASFDISGYPPQMQVILRALKKYGMIVADNGGDFFVSGTADSRWNDALDDALKQVHVSDFEVIRMTGVVTQ